MNLLERIRVRMNHIMVLQRRNKRDEEKVERKERKVSYSPVLAGFINKIS